MEKVIDRKDILTDDYRLIIETECHHEHIIIQDEHGTIRWKKKQYIDEYIENCGGLNNLLYLFYHLGYGKNSEIYRKLYREMGYSLSGYYDVFYWEVNNEDAQEYIDKRKSLNRKLKLKNIMK